MRNPRIPLTRASVCGVAAIALSAMSPSTARAQNLGPFRQFLALEGSYERLQLDAGKDQSRIGLNGYGGRLWINLAPFVGPGSIGDHAAIALFYFTTPGGDQNIFTRHYGADLNIYPLHVPLGNLIDPVLTLGAGRFQISNTQTGTRGTADIQRGRSSSFALTPGVGIRIPIPNRLQLRVDAADLIAFGRKGSQSGSRTSQSLMITAGAGLTF